MNTATVTTSVRRVAGTWISAVTRDGITHKAKTSSSPTDAALSAADLKRHLAFLAGDPCECCTNSVGWIWNLDSQSMEHCPACNPPRDAALVTPRLRAAEGRGRATGNKWLENLGKQKQREDASNRAEKMPYRNRPPQLRGRGAF